jgi:two-component system chemotaxis response regulator CheY
VLTKMQEAVEHWREIAVMPGRVLMIDDALTVRDVLRHHLECIGCEVVAEAENTSQALVLFRTVRPSLVTMNVAVAQSGDVNPLQLLRTMRAERPEVAILMVGSPQDCDLRQVFMDEGALDFLTTPLRPASLERVRQELLELFPGLTPMGFSRHARLRERRH